MGYRPIMERRLGRFERVFNSRGFASFCSGGAQAFDMAEALCARREVTDDFARSVARWQLTGCHRRADPIFGAEIEGAIIEIP